VSELIPRTAPAHKRVNVWVSGKGKKVGIDKSVWLHEFALRHAHALVVEKDHSGVLLEVTTRAAYMVRRGITPVFVFDGEPAVAKGGMHEARAKRRAEAYDRFEARDFEDVSATASNLRAASTITGELVSAVIDAQRCRGFVYIVAPYEADGMPAPSKLSCLLGSPRHAPHRRCEAAVAPAPSLPSSTCLGCGSGWCAPYGPRVLRPSLKDLAAVGRAEDAEPPQPVIDSIGCGELVPLKRFHDGQVARRRHADAPPSRHLRRALRPERGACVDIPGHVIGCQFTQARRVQTALGDVRAMSARPT
jgi:hypothetical protein